MRTLRSDPGAMRYETKYEIGDVGARYEFNIKLPKIIGLEEMPLDDFEMECQDAIEDFARMLRKRYSWIGTIHQTGRSGGWLEIQDAKGLATEAKLRTIMGLVEKAQARFIKDLKQNYGR